MRILFLLSFLFLFLGSANSQSYKHKIKKHQKHNFNKHSIWVEGHFKWNKKRQKFTWIRGHWKKQKFYKISYLKFL